MASNPTTGLPMTGFEPEIQDITRQREMAKLLLQQGMADNMQGQMVSGRYVGASPWQGIAKLYSSYKGGQLAKEADRKQAELAELLRKTGIEETKEIMGLARGTPEQVTYSAEDVGPSRNVTPAVSPDIQGAYIRAVGGRTPQAQALAQVLGKQLMREPKWEKIERLDQKTGNTIVGMIDVNSPQPEMTFREIGTSKPAISPADAARLRFEGIPFSGAVSGGAPMAGGSPMAGGQVTTVGQAPVAGGQPMGGQAVGGQTMQGRETYQYNPALSPKQNQEAAKAFEEKQSKNISNAKESFDVIKQAADIFNTGAPSSGRLKNILTGTAEFFDVETEAAKADSKLTILGQKLTQQVPRFEGPQSNVDVASYQAAAGDVANPNKTIAARMSALQTLIDLNKKYYPQGDWDKIDLAGPVRTRQTFTKGRETINPTEFRARLSSRDQEAFDWVRRNPNHQDAPAIRKRLGIE